MYGIMIIVLLGNKCGLSQTNKDSSDHRQKDGEVIVKTSGRYYNEEYNGAVR